MPHLTWEFDVLVLVVALTIVATWVYIKFDIEPVTEEWRKWQDRIRGYRTQAFSILVMLTGLVDVVDPYALASLFGEDSRGYLTVLIGVCIWALRRITTTPAGNHGVLDD